MLEKNIVVLGGGFAGLWSALGAARKLDELAIENGFKITLVNKDEFHTIRVRLYESSLTPTRVPLQKLLSPCGIDFVKGGVIGVNTSQKQVTVRSETGDSVLNYDCLVVAVGSQLFMPRSVKGLSEHSFNVDTFAGAERLQSHLLSLRSKPDSNMRNTVLVVGAGLTGTETACNMVDRLRDILGKGEVIIADHSSHVGSSMGPEASSVIVDALNKLGIKYLTGIRVNEIDSSGATLDDGTHIETETVIWTAGMRANPITTMIDSGKDSLGRLYVNDYLQMKDIPDVFVPGDAGTFLIDGTHYSVMSCQHARPMGRFAGHNVVAHMLGLPMLALQIPNYVTIVDLGADDAVYTKGWERHVIDRSSAAKRTNEEINCHRIYPPISGERRELLDAAAPVVQSAPSLKH
ncbi:MAG: FAD-dependent oxidoreductase [Cyanobacteria bacterium SZAS-4]|nr:FAD-dependent oxidoreductase [Cyanobacteria bacterium SZAS-4]